MPLRLQPIENRALLLIGKPNLIFESRNQLNEKLNWELKNNELVPYPTKKNIEILQLTDDLIYSISDNSIDSSEMHNLADQIPVLVVCLKEGYAKYEKDNGVVPVPDDYDVLKQLVKNAKNGVSH